MAEMMSTKNSMLPSHSAAMDLGLGDQLNTQVEAEIAERRKKAMQIKGADQGQGIYNPQGLSTAAMSLGLQAGAR